MDSDRRVGRVHSEWWRDAVFYQVYVRSFADGNGDGLGDLEGIRQRLDHLVSLGVDALWLTPFYRSPMKDAGYDVADPRDVDPLFGDLATFDRLLAEAHDRGLKLTVDVVPNHSSDQHVWFQEALASPRGSAARARYLFRDGRGADGATPPNNWPSVFGGPAWTRITEPDGSPGQWYLHLFAPEQPDLDWTNPEVANDLATTLRFWLDRGVDGFRIDVGHGMAKPPGLPDMAITDAKLLDDVGGDLRFDNDGVHEIHRLIRRVIDDYPGAMAVGEIWVKDDDRLRLYIRPDEVHLAFNFRFVDASFSAAEFRSAIEHELSVIKGTDSPPCWVLSNHDVVRHVSRYGEGLAGTRRARAAALLQLALPGVAYLYNGDELGMPNVELPDAVLQDPTFFRSGGAERGRDACRLPIPWSGAEAPFGFSSNGAASWLPLPAGWAPLTVEAQETDPESMLALYRAALDTRRKHPGFAGSLEWLPSPDGVLAFRREGGLVCVVNTTNVATPLPGGSLVLASEPVVDGRLPGDAAAWLA